MKELGDLLSITQDDYDDGLQTIVLTFENELITQTRQWFKDADGNSLHDAIYNWSGVEKLSKISPALVYGLIRRLTTQVSGKVVTLDLLGMEAMTNGKTTVHTYDVLHKHWFEVVSAVEQHTKWDGTVTNPMEHTFVKGRSGVTVVLYDPELEQMALIEEFRIGLLEEDSPWAMGLVTGGIEGSELAIKAAEREAMEEAGLAVTDLVELCEYKLDPGFTSHTMYVFKGRVDLSNVTTDVNGVDTEQEDIKLHILPYSEVKRMLFANEFVSGTTLVALHNFFSTL